MSWESLPMLVVWGVSFCVALLYCDFRLCSTACRGYRILGAGLGSPLCEVQSRSGSMSSIKRDVKEKVLPRPEARFLFSRSSPLKFRFSEEAWPIAHAHKFPPRMVAMPSSSQERQARLVLKVNHGSIRGSWPMAISGSPRGHNV